MEITFNLAIRGNESELADKPGSVLDSHSSGHYVTAGLKQPTRIRRGSHHRIPIWSCSGRGLPCHKLLPVVRCALTAPFHPYHLNMAVFSLLHLPSAHAAQALPGVLPYGARTFLPALAKLHAARLSGQLAARD